MNIRDDLPKIRRAAIDAISIKGPAAITKHKEVLAPCLTDPDGNVRLAAFQAVQQLPLSELQKLQLTTQKKLQQRLTALNIDMKIPTLAF